ncbi:MAG: YcxB family protein [Gemmatimonadaceae bacterium]|nr:YcxB family protein [Gemmatimonadaceae bacterium]
MARPSSILRWRVQADEHYRAIRTLRKEHARQERRIWRELRLLALGVFVCIAIAIIARRWRELHHVPIAYLWVFGVPIVGAAIFAATRPLAMKKAVEQQLADDPSTQQERAYTLDEAGFRIDGESFHVELNWAQLIVVRETSEFLLFFTRKSAYYLPKRAIQWPERLEGIRDLLVEYIGDRADVR